jgi:hypothetical protein
MSLPAIKKKPMTHVSWEDITPEEKQISSWYDSAFHAALDKLEQDHRNAADTIMRLGEAFGRGLYTQRLKEKSPQWTIKDWVGELQKDVYKPLGSEFIFTKISPDVATTFKARNPLIQLPQEHAAATLFDFGVMRGLFLSAFPKGELLLNKEKTVDHPGFIFKAYASARDKCERERVIRLFTFLKKDNGA